MNKKAYIIPLVQVTPADCLDTYCAGENSIPGGGEGGPGIAEGKERKDETDDNDWGSLW
ncbi:MAG: hypothetical protein K5778_09715 [Bacteroidaceae bacterium]|nr:hypothetical protein [Bacteroidaceae bacterium]